MKKVYGAPSSTLRDVGDQRWGPLLVGVGWHAFFARLSTRELKDQSGKQCMTNMRNCTRLGRAKSLVDDQKGSVGRESSQRQKRIIL